MRLQGQPFQVCAILLEHSGNLVTREGCVRRSHPRTPLSILTTRSIQLSPTRIALGDDADNPRFVETLPRRGYRFIGPVDKPEFTSTLTESSERPL